MSSLNREPLTGTIRQGKKVVGGVCLPEEDTQEFIDQFNHLYGPAGLKIDQPPFLATCDRTQRLIPVGAGHYKPIRPKFKE